MPWLLLARFLRMWCGLIPNTVDMDRFRAEAGAVVFGFFGNTRPASTLAAVTRLADPRYLLEVEATAVSAAAT